MIHITIAEFPDGGHIPSKYTCAAGQNSPSPAMSWTGAPATTQSYVLIMHDPEGAPQKSSMDVTHWILWNLPASSTSLTASVKPDSSPDGIAQGKNIRGVNGYQPPCPPPGATPHHYTFELYALDTKLDLPAGSTRADLLKAMDGHVIGKATTVGLYGR
jgi:Raf kinase inhibitor-like YbhB/YbcL family protein